MRMKYLRAAKDVVYRTHLNDLACLCAKPFSHCVSHLGEDEARAELERFYPCPPGTPDGKNRIEEPFSCDLQIVIPAFNVERFLRACLDSVLNQRTRYAYCVVVIDDGSSDATPRIADEYAAADPRVRVIHQKNMGHASVNTGLAHITAPYLMIMDADDALAEGAVESLLDAALEHDADVVQGGYCRLEDGVLIPQKNVRAPREASAYGCLSGFYWGKVFRSSLFETVCFPEGYFHGDSIISFLIQPMSRRRWQIPAYVYHYRCSDTRTSTTAPLRPKCVVTYWITELLMGAHCARGLPSDSSYYDEIMRQVLLNAKRIRKMPRRIREDVFVLTAGLLERFLEPGGALPTVHRPLRRALLGRDFGAYSCYCKTHYYA